MNQLNLADVTKYVEDNISRFHESRLASLNKLKLKHVLKSKNPYLYKAKHMEVASDIVKGIVDAHLSSNEETIFGNWLEGLAIFIIEKVYNGHKSTSDGIDVEFIHQNIHYVVAIKSGPSWGNKDQIAKMKTNFANAKRRLGTSGNKSEIRFVNGCCYGREKSNKEPGDGSVSYFKYCGQEFWEFISGRESLYTDIILPIGHEALKHNQAFYDAYSGKLNMFTEEFLEEFTNDGRILWEKIVEMNSSKMLTKEKSKKTPDKKTKKSSPKKKDDLSSFVS